MNLDTMHKLVDGLIKAEDAARETAGIVEDGCPPEARAWRSQAKDLRRELRRSSERIRDFAENDFFGPAISGKELDRTDEALALAKVAALFGEDPGLTEAELERRADALCGSCGR